MSSLPTSWSKEHFLLDLRNFLNTQNTPYVQSILEEGEDRVRIARYPLWDSPREVFVQLILMSRTKILRWPLMTQNCSLANRSDLPLLLHHCMYMILSASMVALRLTLTQKHTRTVGWAPEGMHYNSAVSGYHHSEKGYLDSHVKILPLFLLSFQFPSSLFLHQTGSACC
jgi:hypothetical protein